eukprot:16444162-Heterocapsa_arctica.AAC.1
MMKESRTLLDETHLTYVEPITHLTANIDNVRYADDLASTGVACTPRVVTWRIRDWDRNWDAYCVPAGYFQSIGKRQLTVRFAGRGAREAQGRLLDTPQQQQVQGKLTHVPLHL